jgi:hypothetical protein
MKLSLEQFNQLIADVTAARQLQRERNEQKALEEELQKGDIETLQRVLQPVLEETVASPIHKLQEGVMKNLKQIEGRQKQLEAIEGREIPKGGPSEVARGSRFETMESGQASSASAIQKKPLNLDPDKGLDIELLGHYKLLKPSEILDEEEPRELVCAYIKNIDTNLKRWGGRISNIQDKNSTEYKLLRRKIDAMRTYKDRIKDLLKALPLAGRGGAMPKGRIGKSRLFSNKSIEYKYYSSPDELVNRLELLCAERDIGNDSIEVRNEIMAILDILLKSKIIDKVDHEEMFRKWCS